MFQDGVIEGVLKRELNKYSDGRGWLMELFRRDEMEAGFFPAMAYISMTGPGVARGPHEHLDQADYFCFAGPSTFKIFLWDNRPSSPTYKNRQIIIAGEDTPTALLVPKNVVHAYKNIGESDGLVINCPNRLFKGEGRGDPVDEKRYEDDPESPYKLD